LGMWWHWVCIVPWHSRPPRGGG